VGDEVGVLVIRAWCEPDREPSFRARVLAVGGSLEQVEVVGVAGSVNEAVDLIRDWLDSSACSH
jgi:hypothetical protein